MSFSKLDRTVQSRIGKSFPADAASITSSEFAALIASALDRDFGDTHAAVKTISRLTSANDRAAKNWVEGRNGPDGSHLVALMAVSDAVLEAVLLAAGRRDLVIANKIVESKRQLLKLLQQLHDLQHARMTTPLNRSSVDAVLCLLKEAQMLDPSDIIREAIHSAFVKYPKEDDLDFSPHWVKPEESEHLARVIMLELEAAGFQIVKKSK